MQILMYVRVSTTRQRLGHQLSTIEQYIIDNGLLGKSRTLFTDYRTASKGWKSREGLSALIHHINLTGTNKRYLLFRGIDRLSRVVGDVEYIYDICREHNIEVIDIEKTNWWDEHTKEINK